MIVDTSALLAFFDSSEPAHRAVADVIENSTEPLVVSPFVVAELDYLVLGRHGARAERLVLEELRGGAWEIAVSDLADLSLASELVSRYSDIPIAIADAMNLVLAGKYGTSVIATLDKRHYSLLRRPDGGPYVIVP